MDFTIDKYYELLETLQKKGYSFQTFSQFLDDPNKKVVILRHDVDKLPLNSLRFARIQHKMGISGSYYFRTVKKSYNEDIIREISALGHEIGYHYETMDTGKGNIELAYVEFSRNLEMFRKIVPVETICMHGSPTSRFDNKTIWDQFDYKKLSIKGEPYFDVDFNKVFYLTDTGRRFDGEKVSIRDKPGQQIYTEWPIYHSTTEIITAIYKSTFPDMVMMTFHPQRWTNNILFWTKELLLQNLKNEVKRLMVNSRNKQA
jgi:hypothetical protein